MNARGKEVDTTSLSVLGQATERGFLHRDYLAHCLRWSHVVRYMNTKRRYQTQHLLDVGCGQELPLAKLLYSSRMTHTTGSYTGVDYGRLARPASIPAETPRFKLKLLEKTDLVTAQLPRKTYDTIVCFEVLEHVEPYHSFQLLKRINSLLTPASRAFISTPCYDPKVGAADNHVNEMSYQAVQTLLALAGLEVLQVNGTFASQRDYKARLTTWPGLPQLFETLSRYYDSNVLACLFAPLFPEHARNCLWQVRQSTVINRPAVDLRQGGPHSSSARWPTDLKKILKEAGA